MKRFFLGLLVIVVFVTNALLFFSIDFKYGSPNLFHHPSSSSSSSLAKPVLNDGYFYFSKTEHQQLVNAVQREIDTQNNLKQEKWTMVILTYKRNHILARTLQYYASQQIESLHKIVIISNNVDGNTTTSLQDLPTIPYQLEIIQATKNTLNNRFNPHYLSPTVETHAVFSCDDDVRIPKHLLQFAFQVWQTERDRIVGFPRRGHQVDSNTTRFTYESENDSVSLSLMGASFYHVDYSKKYFTQMDPKILDIVDQMLNCEDIAFNMLVASLVRRPPIFIGGVVSFSCPECQGETLHQKAGHYQIRSGCISKFSSILGFNPLIRTYGYLSPVLKPSPDLQIPIRGYNPSLDANRHLRYRYLHKRFEKNSNSIKLYQQFFETRELSAFYPNSIREKYNQDPLNVIAPRNQSYPAYLRCYYHSFKENRHFQSFQSKKQMKPKTCRWMVAIFSLFNSKEKRDSIRKTWLSQIDSVPDVCYSFVIGQPLKYDEDIPKVLFEHFFYNDILFLNHTESYLSLTQKSIHSFLRIYSSMKDNGLTLEYLLKTDDDSYVDLSTLRNWIETSVSKDQKRPMDDCIYAGRIDSAHEPVRLADNKFSIWSHEWPFTYLKPFARGAGYVLSSKCLSQMEHSCFHESGLPYLRLEDVAIGNIVSGFSNTVRFNSNNITWTSDCENTFLCHQLSVSQMKDVHNEKTGNN